MKKELCGATINLHFLEIDDEGRSVYMYSIKLPDGKTYADKDLRSGVGQKPSCFEMYGTLLNFLVASAESYGHRINKNISMEINNRDDNLSLFPLEVVEWAYINEQEIASESYDVSVKIYNHKRDLL